MASETVLELDAIEVRYGPVLALDGVSLRLGRGELVCLLGSNAAGKTTTLKTVLGLLVARRGRVRIDGQDVTGLAAASIIRRGVAMVPENRELFPHMTVLENLLLGAYARRDRGDRDAELERIYALFPRLGERRKQAAGTLSGGEQQMAAIGRALMARPRLLLMDEPSMGLAPALVKQTFQTIARIRADGVAILLVEQNAHAALAIADRAYVLQSGRIVLEGRAAELASSDALRRAYLGPENPSA